MSASKIMKVNEAPRVSTISNDTLVTVADKTTGAVSTIEFGDLKNLIRDSIKVGGRNLLKRQILNSCQNITVQGDTITMTKNGDSYWQIPLACNRSELEFGEEYTLSMTVENFPPNATWVLQGYNNSPFDIALANGRCKATFKLTEAYLSGNNFAFDDGKRLFPNGFQPVTISKIKLERGNVATDWSPAPEDLIFGGGKSRYFSTLQLRRVDSRERRVAA